MKLEINYPPVTRETVVVWGLLGSYPFGGMTWQVLHYLAGLRQLGFDVWYVEDSNRPVLNPSNLWHSVAFAENAAYLQRQMDAIDLGDKWVFRPKSGEDTCYGAKDIVGLANLYRNAAAVLNLCGSHYIRPDHDDISCLVYVQTDPVLDQIRIALGEEWLTDQLDRHDVLFSYGENLGNSDCTVPIERYTWKSTRPPVVPEWWGPNSKLPDNYRFTTITTWKDHEKDIEWAGVKYLWRKDLQFQQFIALPQHSQLPLELAVEGINDDDKLKLERHGWHIIPARSLSDPERYRDYIRRSAGEFTIAKDQYVRMRSGWFSDRSVCYLAAGRPVITQETGFSKFIPTGEGLFAFSTINEAAEAIGTIAADYSRHSQAALEIAHEYFDSQRVLSKMMDEIGLL